MAYMELIKQLEEGTITPEEAVRQYEHPGTFIGDINSEVECLPLVCGFPSIEEYQYLRQGKPDLTVIAARPGHGKTALACQIASNVSEHSNVLLFSLEMSKEELKNRFLAQETGRSIKHLKMVKPELLRAANERIKKKRILVDDTNGLDIGQLMSRAVDFSRQGNLSLVVVDYLQIITIGKQGLKAELVSEITQKLKALARRINCPVLALAQMNRSFDGRVADNPQAEPFMSDIADSSGVEKCADCVICLHKPHDDLVRAFVLKNRNGAAKNFSLTFRGETLKFIDRGTVGDRL